MLKGLAGLILTSYLIIFLIGGGRVCGCEALSWIGVEVHEHHDESPCHHHHDSDTPTEEEHGEEHDKEHDNECDHSQSDQPCPKPDCCELALKSFTGKFQKCLELPGISDGGQPDVIAIGCFMLMPRISVQPLTLRLSPPGPSQHICHTRIFQQRFNV